MAAPTIAPRVPMCDIGVNLTDPVFRGEYRGKQKHASDFDAVLERALAAGVEQIIVTAGSLEESRNALELVRAQRALPPAVRGRQPRLYCTVGVHPTRCDEFDTAQGGPAAHLARLRAVIEDANANASANGNAAGAGAIDAEPLVVAVGECGLDYDRTEFCAAETQLRHLGLMFDLAEQTGLPMFLHCRAAQADMLRHCREHHGRYRAAVVHSFDGEAAEAAAFAELGLHVGINGCSLKTARNLDVVRGIPIDLLMLETDAPWCDIRATHAGHDFVASRWPQVKADKLGAGGGQAGACVKGRNEPCTMRQVLEVVAAVRGEGLEELGRAVYGNSLRVFLPFVPAPAVRTSARVRGGATADQPSGPSADARGDDGERPADALDVVFQRLLALVPADGGFGEGFFAMTLGYSAGYAFKAVGKAAALGVGCVFFIVRGLAALGYVQVDARKLQADATRLLDADGDGKLTKKDLIIWYRAGRQLLPSTGGFGVGFAAAVLL
eukprot:g7947.t1